MSWENILDTILKLQLMNISCFLKYKFSQFFWDSRSIQQLFMDRGHILLSHLWNFLHKSSPPFLYVLELSAWITFPQPARQAISLFTASIHRLQNIALDSIHCKDNTNPRGCVVLKDELKEKIYMAMFESRCHKYKQNIRTPFYCLLRESLFRSIQLLGFIYLGFLVNWGFWLTAIYIAGLGLIFYLLSDSVIGFWPIANSP